MKSLEKQRKATQRLATKTINLNLANTIIWTAQTRAMLSIHETAVLPTTSVGPNVVGDSGWSNILGVTGLGVNGL